MSGDLLKVIGQNGSLEASMERKTKYTRLFNLVLTIGQVPKEWIEVIIVPVPKKGDPLEVNNYRGIGLLNSTYKAFTHYFELVPNTFFGDNIVAILGIRKKFVEIVKALEL